MPFLPFRLIGFRLSSSGAADAVNALLTESRRFCYYLFIVRMYCRNFETLLTAISKYCQRLFNPDS